MDIFNITLLQLISKLVKVIFLKIVTIFLWRNFSDSYAVLVLYIITQIKEIFKLLWAIGSIWHYGGCLNKRAARLRLAVQAPAITNNRTRRNSKRTGTGGRRWTAWRSAPISRAAVFEWWCLVCRLRYISAVCRLSHTAQYPYSNGFNTEECTFAYSRYSQIKVYNFACWAVGKRQNKPKWKFFEKVSCKPLAFCRFRA